MHIAELNQMSQAEFVAVLGAVFENTPAIAHQTWHNRPFVDATDLHQKMMTVVNAMDRQEQLALIRAHPDLGSKATMADASIQEQAEVGLNRLTAVEYDHFQRLNQTYKERFGFPFLIAVKNHTKVSILTTFEQRLRNPFDVEIQQALTEIGHIAWFRLAGMGIQDCT